MYYLREFVQAGGLLSYGPSMLPLIAKRVSVQAAFSIVTNQPPCQCCSPQAFYSPSIWRRQKLSACKFRRRYLRWPTRLSN